MFTRELAKVSLKRKGWSYRAAAPVLGVTYQHLCLVLCGRRESGRLMQAIAEIRTKTKTVAVKGRSKKHALQFATPFTPPVPGAGNTNGKDGQ